MDSAFLAVTIGVGTRFAPLARLAAATCAARTGLPVEILGEDAMQRYGLSKPHHLKFVLFEEFPAAETILYFDSDLLFVRDLDAAALAAGGEFVCVRDFWDRPWIAEDAARIGVAPREYFNSGFLLLHRGPHAPLLHLARQLCGRIPASFHDQTQLNAARAWLRTPTRWLGKHYNYLVRNSAGWPATEEVIAAHLFWLDAKPLETQLRYHQYWRRDPITDTPALRAAEERLLAHEYVYERIGHDERRMRLAPEGSFVRGRGGCESRWRLTEEEGRPVLWLAGSHLPTCAFEEESGGVWHGRWLHWEQMAVRLCPAPG